MTPEDALKAIVTDDLRARALALGRPLSDDEHASYLAGHQAGFVLGRTSERSQDGPLLSRLHASMAATEREAMGLHAALHEAIRRLNSVHMRTDDLLLALENPGSAPLNWRGGNPQPRRHRSQSDLAQEYTRIFGGEQ